jgi:hypothetical protein
MGTQVTIRVAKASMASMDQEDIGNDLMISEVAVQVVWVVSVK